MLNTHKKAALVEYGNLGKLLCGAVLVSSRFFISPLFCWNAEFESKVVIGVISDHDESGYNL